MRYTGRSDGLPNPKLFITDLDGTLAGDAAALRKFKTFLQDFPQPPRLVYVTGRHVHSARQLISEDELPWPHTLITDIGTAIYTGATLREDSTWQQQMQQEWDPEAIINIGDNIRGLTLQDLPNTKRVSFLAENVASVTALENQLIENQLAHKLIYSADTYVDVLPRGSGKGRAVSYVLDTYYGRDADILISGDSGNDAEMLELGYPSVIVGNGHPELDYLRNKPSVYKATGTHAAGIYEGWQYFYAARPVGRG